MKSENKVLSEKSKYYIDTATYCAVIHYVRLYAKWLSEYNALSHSVKSPAAEPLPPSGVISDSTANLAERRAILAGRMKEIEDTCVEAAPDICNLLLYAVTTPGVGFRELEGMGIECSRNTYYRKRRKFFYLLAKKLDFIS